MVDIEISQNATLHEIFPKFSDHIEIIIYTIVLIMSYKLTV